MTTMHQLLFYGVWPAGAVLMYLAARRLQPSAKRGVRLWAACAFWPLTIFFMATILAVDEFARDVADKVAERLENSSDE